MPDVRILTAFFSYEILLWTLGYVHLYSRPLFFLFFFLFVAIMTRYTELNTDSLRRFKAVHQDVTSLTVTVDS
jgi:hypothetical protein